MSTKQFLELNYNQEYNEKDWNKFKSKKSDVKNVVEGVLEDFNNKTQENVVKLDHEITFEYNYSNKEFFVWFTFDVHRRRKDDGEVLNPIQLRWEICDRLEEEIKEVLSDFNYSNRIVEGW